MAKKKQLFNRADVQQILRAQRQNCSNTVQLDNLNTRTRVLNAPEPVY